jgi:hypothetical protein
MVLTNRRTRLIAWMCVPWAAAAQSSAAQAIGKNLVANGGFEQAGDGWAFTAMGANAAGQVANDQAHTGKSSYRLSNQSALAPNIFGRVFQTVARLEPFTTYRISCWVKGKDVGIAWIGGGPGWYLRKPFPQGTYDWKPVSVEYTTDGNPPSFELMILLESPTAALWVDDVKMQAVRADAAKRDEVLNRIKAQSRQQKNRLLKVRSLVGSHPQAQADPVVQLALYVADRFLRRIESGGPKGTQSMDWTTLQLEEVAEVLTDAERRIGRAATQPAASVPLRPSGGAVKSREGLFYSATKSGGERPFYFYGYGHFGQVFEDLPNFRTLGASIVQDGRVGPSAMNADGSLQENAQQTLRDLKRAARYGIKVDWLLSPHYFPEWGYAQAADVRGGGPGFLTINIDHPSARKVIEQFVSKMSAAMKGEAALFSVCLSNEPVYQQSGRDPYSRPAFVQFLRARHGEIAALNGLYGTSYKSFDDVPAPAVGLKATEQENRAYYDWVQFNQQHFADWHAWLRSLVRKDLPNVPTHAKIMVFFTLDRDKLHFGVDPELFCNATDLAGCDAYAFPEGDKAYGWHGHEFFYDLLYSFRHQSVFNSENHIIPDGSGAWHIPPAMTNAQFWQGGLHHQGVTTTWVWDEPSDPSFVGSIYFRPANIYAAGRAMLDLNRLGKEVAAISQFPPRVALLYSPTSIFWEDAYKGTIFSLYRQLTFLGEPVTFVSEKQLASGGAPKVQWIVLPQATHVADSTIKGLRAFIDAGGHVLQVGENNLAYDQYHRPRELGEPFIRAAKLVPQKDESATGRMLHDLLAQGGLKLADLIDAETGQPTWGVEFRVVPSGERTLMPLINMGPGPCQVKLPVSQGSTAIDLLSGESVDVKAVRLTPMTPRLLEIAP